MTREEALEELRQKRSEGFTGVYAMEDDTVYYVTDMRGSFSLPDGWQWASVIPVDLDATRVLVAWLAESRTNRPEVLGGAE